MSEFFIAHRIFKNREGEKNISPPAVHVAVISMALGLAVMILSVAIVVGFKKEVRNKVIGFGSHIQITNFNSNSFYEMNPIAVGDTLFKILQNYPNISHVQRFSTKPGIIKTGENSQGVVFKGVDENYDWDFFKQNLIEGNIPNIRPDSTTTDILISKKIADKLFLKLGDSFLAYFVRQNDVSPRKFHITGVYQTNFSDYDKLFIFIDIKQIRRINQWDADMASGMELIVKDYEQLEETTDALYFDMQSRTDRLGNTFYTCSIEQLNAPLFAWLDVLDMNVVVILILMIIVASFSMISGLLIIILERANMIGILKALGGNNASIRKIFLYMSTFLIGKGLFWGNLIALSVCFIQKYTGAFKLNPETYILSEVPVEINWVSICLINFGTLVITLLLLIVPSCMVAKISPAKTIRFE
ncbi:MAG: ABC transporter permease [Dysgonamonadaceae bacterium]|jgi:lipoprotein-releasing system permease protein|nr:ABC transporter permease [Dysgonamonadaceae bacterium]